MNKRISSIMDTRKKKTGVLLACIILIFAMSTGVFFAAYAPKDIYVNGDYPVYYAQVQLEMPEHVREWYESLIEIDGRKYAYNQISERIPVVFACPPPAYQPGGYRLVPVHCWETGHSYMKMYEGRTYVKQDGEWVICEHTAALPDFPPPTGFNDTEWIQATPDCVYGWVADGRIGGVTLPCGRAYLLPPFTEVFADAPLETAIAATGAFPYGTTIEYVANLCYYDKIPHIQWLIRRARYELGMD